MTNQNDVFIVKTHQPLQCGQEFSSDFIPCPEGIITFMCNSHLFIHVQSALFIGVFKKVNHNGLEGVVLLFQFADDILEHFPSLCSFGHPSDHFNLVFDRDERCIHKLDVSISVQHQRVRELVCKGGLSAEG